MTLSVPAAARLARAIASRLERLEREPERDRSAALAATAFDARELSDGLDGYALDALAATFDDARELSGDS